MDNRELEHKIMSSYRNIAPDILDSVLTDCDEQKGRVINMQKKKKKRSIVKYFGSVAAALVLLAGGMGIYRGNHVIDSTIMLDVNPGIEITVNKSEKVLDVTPYNKDAEIVIGDMDFSGSNLDVTVNALIGSMLRNGYISEDSNSILVTVDSKDPADGQVMQARLMNEINSIIEGEKLSGAVLGQTLKEDNELQKLADHYGITIGKAKLIDQITRQNSLYSFADLVPLTINELNLISESGKTKLENVESIGTASASAYIGEKQALDTAFKRAGVSAENASGVRCELDWEKGIMIYEVDFDADGMEYEVDIDATIGEVLKFDNEPSDDYHPAQGNSKGSSGNKSGAEEAAKQAAFRHAGVVESDVIYCVCEPEHKRGLHIYEIEFSAGGMEYDYDINADTCEVLRYSKEYDDDYDEQQSVQSGDIGAEAAKAAALNHAGVSDIREYECELDYERGMPVYEISFVSNGFEYDYEINAADGTVLKSEKERD